VRINMDKLRTALARFHGPAEPDGVRLSHVRAHDQYTVAIFEILLKSRRRAASK
jgi:hypothetical protein